MFTILDAKDGFYQIALDEASSKLTTFWTPFGRYRYLRMPFGVNTAPEERRYAQIEKECLAIVFGCQKFSQYITRRAKITVESDHKPLQAIFKKSLLEAPCRLQRMMLRLQRYNLDVIYKPGPQMYIADHLSRASMSDSGTPDKEFQVFALELEGIGPLSTIKISSERLAQLQKATEQDPVMQTLKTTILMGWPTERDEVPVHIREFWTYRDELTLHNGVLFKNQRLIIPKALRTEVTSRIHSKPAYGKQGI